MVDPAARTTQLVEWIARMRTGDLAARDELIRGFQGRLELLARKMVGRDWRIAQWVDAEDVLQNALLRLLRALETVQPDSTRAFFGLAAEQMRRELLDLARHYYGPEGQGANHDSGAATRRQPTGPRSARPGRDRRRPGAVDPIPRGGRTSPSARARRSGPGLLPGLDPGPGGRGVRGRRADRPTLVGIGVGKVAPDFEAGRRVDSTPGRES
jgi:ECF sigma factor